MQKHPLQHPCSQKSKGVLYSHYVVLFLVNCVPVVSNRLLNNITRTLTQMPLCVAPHNGIVVQVLMAIFERLFLC